MGFLINSIQFTFQIPESKLAKLKRSLQSLILDGRATNRELARLVGFIISLSLAVGPIARLFTRQMYFFIQSRPVGDISFTFPGALLQELKFLLQHIDSLNGYSIRECFVPLVLFTPMLVILLLAAIWSACSGYVFFC